MDRVFKKINNRMRNLNKTIGHRNLKPIRLSSLMYVDDVVPIVKTERKLHELIHLLNKEIEDMKMEVNTNKSEVMIINSEKEKEVKRGITCKGDKEDVVSTYEYLIDENGQIDAKTANMRYENVLCLKQDDLWEKGNKQ